MIGCMCVQVLLCLLTDKDDDLIALKKREGLRDRFDPSNYYFCLVGCEGSLPHD